MVSRSSRGGEGKCSYLCNGVWLTQEHISITYSTTLLESAIRWRHTFTLELIGILTLATRTPHSHSSTNNLHAMLYGLTVHVTLGSVQVQSPVHGFFHALATVVLLHVLVINSNMIHIACCTCRSTCSSHDYSRLMVRCVLLGHGK